MALITAPELPIRSLEWSFDRPSQGNIGVSGKRSVEAEPLYGKHYARVELAARVGESTFRQLRSFFVRLQGPVNTFRLEAVGEAQNGNSGVTVAGTVAAGVTSFNIGGAATSLLEGQMVTVNDQLLTLVADQSGNTITFEPPLRAQATAGAAVETSRPWALVRLAGAEAEWGVSLGPRFDASFEVEEAV